MKYKVTKTYTAYYTAVVEAVSEEEVWEAIGLIDDWVSGEGEDEDESELEVEVDTTDSDTDLYVWDGEITLKGRTKEVAE